MWSPPLKWYEQFYMLRELIGTGNWYWEIHVCVCGGVLPYINHIDMCRPKVYGFCAFTGCNRVWFSREQRECRFQFQMNREERDTHVSEFETHFKKSFGSLNFIRLLRVVITPSVTEGRKRLEAMAWNLGSCFFSFIRSNLINDDIISERPSPKTGVEMTFRSEIKSGSQPHQDFPGVPPPGKILISKSIQENVCCKYYSSKALENFSFYTKYFITDLQKRMKT